MGEDGGSPATVERALEAVTSWRESRLKAQRIELEELEVEVARIEASIAKFTAQRTSLESAREQLHRLPSRVGVDAVSRSYQAIFDTLHRQSEGVRERAAVVSERRHQRMAALAQQLAQGDDGELLADYQEFPEMVIRQLPPSYRRVVEAHHVQLERQLQQTTATLRAPIAIQGAPLVVDVVFTVDAPDGAPDLLIVVLPVAEQVIARWEARDDDLQTQLAARTMQGVYRAAVALGVADGQAMYGGHRGLLAIEIEIPGDRSQDIRGCVQAAIQQAFQNAEEVSSAQVEVRPVFVPVDYLLPPNISVVEEVSNVR